VSLDITVTDLFCGAGGSSIGAEAAGARLVMAANHWRLAIDTHNTNFPHADHDCADVSQVDPRRYPRTDVLIASPECTNHSSAKTRKARATLWDPRADDDEERSRATMWDVPRFAEHHRYELVVVENVVEARRWAPFDAWLAAMHSLGYAHRALYLNSFIAHPTPQSRDRMYVVFWRVGNPAPDLDFRPVAWCATCEGDVEAIQAWKNPARPFGKYRAQYVFRCPRCSGVALPYAWPAAAAIDWALPAPRIGDRQRPLADATLRRIRAGLDRYGPAAIVQAAGHTYERPGYYRTWPTWAPLGTQTTTIQHGLVVETAYAGRGDADKSRSTMEPLRTATGQQTQALVVPMREHGRAVPSDGEPLSTVVASSSEHALVVTLRGTSDAAIEATARPANDPLSPQTTQRHDALVVPLRTHGIAEPRVAVEDCGFRMLEPHEIGRAMAFDDSYVVLGNKRERVRQYGNAVTPPVMSLILARAIASLAGGRAA
jgi:DNA (cytosine-5)-methyltransferase 1